MQFFNGVHAQTACIGCLSVLNSLEVCGKLKRLPMLVTLAFVMDVVIAWQLLQLPEILMMDGRTA
jgi:hypothetical protein